MSRLIHEVKVGRACDSLQIRLEAELAISDRIIEKADSLIIVKQKQIDLEREGGKILKFQIQNKQDEIDHHKREVRKWKTYAIGAGVIALLSLFL